MQLRIFDNAVVFVVRSISRQSKTNGILRKKELLTAPKIGWNNC